MAKKEKPSKKAKGDKGKTAKKKESPVKAKYDYPKDCVTDADKKKYRSLMRADKEWTGPTGGGSAKSSKKKKDHGPEKSVTFNKGKKKEYDNPGAKKKKKSEVAED